MKIRMSISKRSKGGKKSRVKTNKRKRTAFSHNSRVRHWVIFKASILTINDRFIRKGVLQRHRLFLCEWIQWLHRSSDANFANVPWCNKAYFSYLHSGGSISTPKLYVQRFSVSTQIQYFQFKTENSFYYSWLSKRFFSLDGSIPSILISIFAWFFTQMKPSRLFIFKSVEQYLNGIRAFP